jgi:MFS family permease
MSDATASTTPVGRTPTPALTERITTAQTISPVAAFGMMLLLGVSYAFNGMDRQVFPALLGPITREYQLTLAQGGFLSTVFALNIALFGALSGWFIVRFGRKWTLVGGLFAYSAFTLLTPLAWDFGSLTFFRAMTGAGEALHIAAIYAMVGAYFGARRGSRFGMINASFGVGAFIGPVFGTRLFIQTGSWHDAFYVFGIAGIVTATLIGILTPRVFATAVDAEKAKHTDGAATSLNLINRNSMMCFLGFAMVGYSFFAYTALYTSYLRNELGYGITEAGQAFGMFGIGALCGLFGGWLAEKLKWAGLLGSLAALTIVSYVMFHDTSGFWLQSALSFAYGALVSGYLYPRFVALMQRSVDARHIAHAMAMCISAFYAAGLFAGVIFGKLVDSLGWSTATTLCVALPAFLALVISFCQQPHLMRGA